LLESILIPPAVRVLAGLHVRCVRPSGWQSAADAIDDENEVNPGVVAWGAGKPAAVRRAETKPYLIGRQLLVNGHAGKSGLARAKKNFRDNAILNPSDRV